MSIEVYWEADRVGQIMRDNGIGNRSELADRLQARGVYVTLNTIYKHFDKNWAGRVSLCLLGSIARAFNVAPGSLIR